MPMNTGEGSSEEERERIRAHVKTVLRRLSGKLRKEDHSDPDSSTQKRVKVEGEEQGS